MNRKLRWINRCRLIRQIVEMDKQMEMDRKIVFRKMDR